MCCLLIVGGLQVLESFTAGYGGEGRTFQGPHIPHPCSMGMIHMSLWENSPSSGQGEGGAYIQWYMNEVVQTGTKSDAADHLPFCDRKPPQLHFPIVLHLWKVACIDFDPP